MRASDTNTTARPAVRLTRWKTAMPFDLAQHFAGAIGQGADVELPLDAATNAREIANYVNNAARRAGGFPRYAGSSMDYELSMRQLTDFTSPNDVFDVDLWQLDYGDTVHASVSVVSHSLNHALREERVCDGRAFGNHLITGSRGFMRVAAYSSTKYGDDYAMSETSVADLVCDPDEFPSWYIKYTSARDILEATNVSVVSGPTLDNAVWSHTHTPGFDINFDMGYPDGIVTGNYDISRRDES